MHSNQGAEANELLTIIAEELHVDARVTPELLRVSPFQSTSVHRLHEGNRRFVVKILNDISWGTRILAIEAEVREHGLPSANIVASGSVGESMWIAFEDVGRTPKHWTRHRVSQAMKVLASIHLTPSCTFQTYDESHTPRYTTIFDQVHSYTERDFRSMLEAIGVPHKPCGLVTALFRASHNWLPLFTNVEAVPSHGDYHGGNVLFTSRNVTPKVIDWEFAHRDVPYFDLFQFLDATSPVDPLPQKGSRKFALDAYLNCTRAPSASNWRRDWMNRYYRFAMLHLLWILTLIHSDLNKQTNPSFSLQRQLDETVQGLLVLRRLAGLVTSYKA